MNTTTGNDDTSVMWGIHAGKTGDAHGLFLNNGCIAIGFIGAGKVGHLSADRQAFKEHVATTHPNMKPGAIPNVAGQLFRFVHMMKPNDLVVYPSKTDKMVHVGRITGDYEYTTTEVPGYPHRRRVEWLKHVPRTRFTQGGLYEIGSALSLFQVKNYADEFMAVVQSNSTVAAADDNSTADDQTIAAVAEEIEQSTSDFVLKQLAKELKGHPFAEFVGELLGRMGYRTRVAPPGPDGGVDIVAHKDELGFEPPIIKVQVKSTTGSVGDPETSALYGKVAHGEFGLMVTLGTYTKPAITFANTKANLRLIDGEELVRLVLHNYEALDSRYKGVIPLKQVYVPQAIEDDPNETWST